MENKKNFIEDIERTLYDIKDKDNSVYREKVGLTEDIVRDISERKHDPKWMLDLLIKKRRQNAADHQFLKSNGHGYKLFEKLLDLIGNPYKGGDGWH